MEQPHHHHHHHHLNHQCHRHRHHHHHHHHMLIHPCSISSSHHHRHVILHHCALHNPITNPQPALPNTPSPASFQTPILQDDGANKFDDEEDEELTFVMTDEWRDFFAKSDARRREAKRLAKRQGKS